jgi:hypothetical protein
MQVPVEVMLTKRGIMIGLKFNNHPPKNRAAKSEDYNKSKGGKEKELAYIILERRCRAL